MQHRNLYKLSGKGWRGNSANFLSRILAQRQPPVEPPLSCMKHSPLFLVAAMLTGGLLAQGETSLDVQLTVNDLDDPEAVAHEFSITFGASLSIDTASLGDNDILIGRGSLFDTQLGEEAFSPELARVDTQNGASTATYRMDRPAEGWASWGIARLSISLASSGVSDQSGKFLPAQNLGFLNLDLAAVPQMAVQVPRYPIIEGEADPSVTFEVLYQTNYAIEITALGKGEISMTRLDASPQFITVNDSLVQVPS